MILKTKILISKIAERSFQSNIRNHLKVTYYFSLILKNFFTDLYPSASCTPWTTQTETQALRSKTWGWAGYSHQFGLKNFMKIINISQVRVACISPYLQLFWDLGIHTYILGIFSPRMKNIEILRIHIKDTQTYFKNVMKETNYKNKKKQN